MHTLIHCVYLIEIVHYVTKQCCPRDGFTIDFLYRQQGRNYIEANEAIASVENRQMGRGFTFSVVTLYTYHIPSRSQRVRHAGRSSARARAMHSRSRSRSCLKYIIILHWTWTLNRMYTQMWARRSACRHGHATDVSSNAVCHCFSVLSCHVNTMLQLFLVILH